MKTKDLFAGCSVTITPHDDVWVVSLRTDDLKTVAMMTYHDLPTALEAVHECMLMLGDETEIHSDAAAVVTHLRERLAKHALDESQTLPTTMEELTAHDDLRMWFEREMGTQ
jgi:hypothetical protein